MGDTAWLLFTKLNREQAETYLEDRQQKGFNVIQVMVLPSVESINVYGDSALIHQNVATPRVTEGSRFTDSLAYDYWDHVKLFERWEELGIGYLCGGRLLGDIKAYVSALAPLAFQHYHSGEQVWEYVELGDCRGTWKRFRRAIFTRPRYEGAQQLLAFARPETILYTNLGRGERIDEWLAAAGCSHWSEAEHLIAQYHERGADELVHRALKEFRSEQLPFKRFAPNAAFYFCMLTAFFLYETFKQDVTDPIVPLVSYPTRLRRTLIDIAGKIVRTGGKTILKVTTATFSRLHIDELWSRSADPPRLNPRLCMA